MEKPTEEAWQVDFDDATKYAAAALDIHSLFPGTLYYPAGSEFILSRRVKYNALSEKDQRLFKVPHYCRTPVETSIHPSLTLDEPPAYNLAPSGARRAQLGENFRPAAAPVGGLPLRRWRRCHVAAALPATAVPKGQGQGWHPG